MNNNLESVSSGLYTSGEYLERHPLWHVEESAWKARQVDQMLVRNHLSPKTICEVGCGAGEVLKSLQVLLGSDCTFCGYDISPQALELARPRSNERLEFKLGEIAGEDCHFDLLLVLDVIEHLQDYFSFLATIRSKAAYKVFHFPLDLSVQTVIRRNGLLKVRAHYGHLHYFTKETALRALQDAGYEIVDHFYTARATELPTRQLPRKIMNLPRRLLFTIHQDLAVKLLGGWSLLVLAR